MTNDEYKYISSLSVNELNCEMKYQIHLGSKHETIIYEKVSCKFK